jgi:hypothetical protein
VQCSIVIGIVVRYNTWLLSSSFSLSPDIFWISASLTTVVVVVVAAAAAVVVVVVMLIPLNRGNVQNSLRVW